MAFKGRDPVRTETGLDNKTVEQVNSFNYLGNMVSYEKELDIYPTSGICKSSHRLNG